MTRTVDTLVIGGGLNGCGLAYYLTQEGVDDVLVVEADTHGAGATGGSMGNVRQQGFGTELEIECSRRGLAFWKSVEERFGMPCTFHEDGYLLLTGREETAQILQEQAGLQRSLGMPDVELLDPDGIRDLVPFLEVDDLLVGSYTPRDGHVMPMDGLTAFAKAARDGGANIEQDWKVERVERQADGTWRAEGKEPVVASRVIVAAGAGTRDLLQPFDIDIDIFVGTWHGLLTSEAFAGRVVPTVIDVDNGMCVEREGQGLLLAMLGRNPASRDHEHLVELFVEAATERAPALTELEITHQLTAYPTLGGDGHPYVGQVDDGLWALAFTGHGAMHGPPVAEALVRDVVGRPDPTLDMSEWDVRRTPGERTVLWRRDATS